jgi:hypothetical protein
MMNYHATAVILYVVCARWRCWTCKANSGDQSCTEVSEGELSTVISCNRNFGQKRAEYLRKLALPDTDSRFYFLYSAHK